MDANAKKRYDKAGPQVVKALEKRHFEAYYVSTAVPFFVMRQGLN